MSSKKVIGPAMPPHLQHLDMSLHSSTDSGSQSKLPKYPPPANTRYLAEEDTDDSVLVLHASDDESLVDVLKDSASRLSSSCKSDERESNSTDDENSFGPTLPPQFKETARSQSSTKDCESKHRRPHKSDLKTRSREQSENSDEEDIIGPSLPPSSRKNSERNSKSPVEDDTFGPEIPSDFKKSSSQSYKKHSSDEEDSTYGPILPPCLKEASQSSKDDASSDEGDSFTPPLPPNFKLDSGVGVIGPVLPSSFQAVAHRTKETTSDSDDDVVGPVLPQQDGGTPMSYAQQLLEERALRLKLKATGEGEDSAADKQTRETWMLELPPDRAGEFGLGPRQFRAREKLAMGDRSVWTDTPSDRERKAENPDQEKATSTASLQTEMQMRIIADRDQEMQKLTEKHNKKKKRKESLVDLHQKKLKKQKKKDKHEGKSEERRPFDRNVDLQANRFDEAQKKAILRKAQFLDDRFSRGESKFL